MTTQIDFKPSITSPFQFQATLDGTIYTILIPWNLTGRRYYCECYTLTGARIFALPLIASPLDYDISLSAGYFTTKLVFRESTSQFEIG